MSTEYITEEIQGTIWQSLQKAIELKQTESIKAFHGFFRNILRESLTHKNLGTFRQYIGFTSEIYRNISYHQSTSTGYSQIFSFFVPSLSLHLKEIILYPIGITARKEESIEGKNLYNKFYYEAFNAFNDHFYLVLRHRDWNIFFEAIKNFFDLGEGAYDFEPTDNFRLAALMEKGELTDESKRLKSLQAFAIPYNNFKRQIITALKYWLYFLREKEVLPEDVLITFLEKASRYYKPDKEVEDLLFFRSGETLEYMNWDHWDYMERPTGESYNPPAMWDWATEGFLLDRIRTRNNYFKIDEIPQQRRSLIPSLYEKMLNHFESLTSNYKKWERLLRVNSEEELRSEGQKILDSVSNSVRKVLNNREKEIEQAELDQEKIADFKIKAGQAWKKQLRIRKVFEAFGNMKNITGQEDIRLKQVGQNMFLERGKMAFISGKYYSRIYGLEDLGAKTARWEDDLFFQLLKDLPIETEPFSSVEQALASARNVLKEKGYKASVIFVQPEMLSQQELPGSSLYSEKSDERFKDHKSPFFTIGTLDDIPLITSFSIYLRSRIIVCDFSLAFEMNEKTNPEWYDSRFKIDVKEVSDEIAEEKLGAQPERWALTDKGEGLSTADSLTLIKTSIIIDYDTLLDFYIKEPSAIVVYNLQNGVTE